MNDKNEIIWRRESSTTGIPHYVSACGRWKILHPKNNDSGRWELFDLHADYPQRLAWKTLGLAKQRAYQLQRTGR